MLQTQTDMNSQWWQRFQLIMIRDPDTKQCQVLLQNSKGTKANQEGRVW